MNKLRITFSDMYTVENSIGEFLCKKLDDLVIPPISCTVTEQTTAAFVRKASDEITNKLQKWLTKNKDQHQITIEFDLEAGTATVVEME